MDKNTDNDEKVLGICPICQGTGFHKGKFCVCITGKNDDIPPEFKELFGDVFK